MDSNNWRQPSQTEQPPMDGAGVDWRSLLPPDSRHRIVNKIMDTLKRHLPSSGQEGDQELKKIAMRFEEKIYHAATGQSDYLRRISLKMLTMESKSNPSGPMPNAMPSNSEDMSRNSQDPGSQSMQPQVQNQGQSLPILMASNQPTVQGRPQLLTQNIQSNINNAGVQSSATALPSVNSLAKNNMPNVMQNSWLPPDSRQRIVNKIMDKLRLHLPSSGHEGVQELEELAMEFEEYIYHEAIVQSDYLRRISFKMLTMESESNPPDPMPNAMPSNSADTSKNSQDPGIPASSMAD